MALSADNDTGSSLQEGFDLILDRQLSAASQHVAKRCIASGLENVKQVEKALLTITRAHQAGIISLREKLALKDLLLSEGSKAVFAKLSKFPGMRTINLDDDGRSTSALLRRDGGGSKTVVFHSPSPPSSATSAAYSITMLTSEARVLAAAITHGKQARMVVRSTFHVLARTLHGWTAQLNPGTLRVLEEPNAGGNSFNSEALSFELIQQVLRASNLLTEMEILYSSNHSPMVDYICTTELGGGHRIGVSVTRAMHFCGSEHFDAQCATTLLGKKLAGLARASELVCSIHAFQRQILHVFAQSEVVGDLVKSSFEREFQSAYANTCLLITVCESALDRFVFKNERCEDAVRDPLAFEQLKQEVRRRERDIVTNLIQRQVERKRSTELALRRIDNHHAS